ncbi:MAG: GatB/YqeY domain-containing protein [Alphaproteobacteria bacterium]|nr:GatB/YqeY domain-containing protein [Alphaproteobacteria bacterium]MCZ6606119.1 GatB/YqeY domain-containing protein [Alphaproteobacteria bacterium]
MLRTRLNDALKAAMKAKETRTLATVRLILAALKDRDIAARGKGNLEGIDEDGILAMLQSMIKQRRESITLYEKGGRLELARQEAEEITVIEQFLPRQLGEDEMAEAVKTVIQEVEAKSLKDMGRTMAALKERYAGRMDFHKASAQVKERLG